MTISNQASGIRPGVCSSTTRPTAPFTGQIIYETDTGYLRVWDGANWDYLSQKQDTARGLPAGDTMGMQLIASGSFTNATSNSALSLTNFTTDFPHYKIVMTWTQATAAGYLNIQLRNNSGTIISTATYDNQRIDYYSNTVLAGGSLGNNAWITLAYNYNLGFQSYFTADIMYATVAQPTILTGRGGTKRTGGGGTYMYVIDSHGMQTDNTIMSGMVLYPDGGSMSGSYSLYGYRN